MIMIKNDFSYYVRKFLTSYLPQERGYSENTIDTYRYTFILLLEYLKIVGIKAEKVKISHLTREVIEAFLDYLENERNNSPSSRNGRLAAINSFFKFLQYEYPDYLDEYISIMSIPLKKTKIKPKNQLSIDEMKYLLEQPDINTKRGYRDYMIILTLYNTAVRVSKLINMRIIDFRLDKPYSVSVVGKGNKIRHIPLSEAYVVEVKKYMSLNQLRNKSKTALLFTNPSNQQLTRMGITNILNKYVDKARSKHPNLFQGKITPHVLRHTKAYHLLHDDVNLVYIRDILGHSSIQTTEIYARTDSARLRKVIDEAYKDLSKDEEPDWQNDSVLEWLKRFD